MLPPGHQNTSKNPVDLFISPKENFVYLNGVEIIRGDSLPEKPNLPCTDQKEKEHTPPKNWHRTWKSPLWKGKNHLPNLHFGVAAIFYSGGCMFTQNGGETTPKLEVAALCCRRSRFKGNQPNKVATPISVQVFPFPGLRDCLSSSMKSYISKCRGLFRVQDNWCELSRKTTRDGF